MLYTRVQENAGFATLLVGNNPLSLENEAIGFDLLDRSIYVPVSWSEQQQFFIYETKTAATSYTGAATTASVPVPDFAIAMSAASVASTIDAPSDSINTANAMSAASVASAVAVPSDSTNTANAATAAATTAKSPVVTQEKVKIDFTTIEFQGISLGECPGAYLHRVRSWKPASGL